VYTEALSKIHASEKSALSYVLCGLLACAAALSGVLLYWYARKVTRHTIKGCFFAFFGWLPGLRKFDKLASQETKSKELRKEQRAWDREHPVVTTEWHYDYDENGKPDVYWEDVVENPVRPIRDEVFALIRNTLWRVVKGTGLFAASIGVLLVIPFLSVFVMALLASTIQEISLLVVVTTLLLVAFLIVLVIHPILALTIKPHNPDDEKTSDCTKNISVEE
jgi:hypothetical protein